MGRNIAVITGRTLSAGSVSVIQCQLVSFSVSQCQSAIVSAI